MNEISRTKWRLAALAAAAGLAAAGDASAQLYKCKGPDGKVVYSDRRCEASDTAGKLAPGVSNRAREIEEKAAADKAAADKAAADLRLQAEARAAAERKLDAEAAKLAPPPPDPEPGKAMERPAPYQLTSRDREHIRELEMTAGSLGATEEQKTAARWHIDSIRRGRDAQLSSGDRERRDSLVVDLSGADAKKRARALRELQSLYYR
jgi:hypothetical protein